MNEKLLIGILVVVGAAGAFGYTTWKEKQAEKTVTEWINAQPVYAMVLKDHPAATPHIFQHFIGPYKESGMAGVEAAKPEMQQILNVNYLVDYVWYIDDAAIRNYLTSEYNFLSAVKKNDPAKTLCAKYLKDSANFSEADKIAGGGLFEQYMKASEALFASALPHKLYPVWPGVTSYKKYVDGAKMGLVFGIARQFQNGEIDQALRNPDQHDCTAVVLIDYAMIKVDPRIGSIIWRDNMESFRGEIVKQRKANGTD